MRGFGRSTTESRGGEADLRESSIGPQRPSPTPCLCRPTPPCRLLFQDTQQRRESLQRSVAQATQEADEQTQKWLGWARTENVGVSSSRPCPTQCQRSATGSLADRRVYRTTAARPSSGLDGQRLPMKGPKVSGLQLVSFGPRRSLEVDRKSAETSDG